MKKLLMVGAMLVLGATSFAGVEVELNNTSGTNYSGKGTMTVGSTGYAVEGVTNGTLIVTPTMSEGADGTSLEFKFGDLVKGSNEVATGRFKAEIVKDDGSGNQVTVNLNNAITAKLETVTSDGAGTTTITDKGNKIEAIDLKPSNGGVKFGILSYELTSQKENNAGKTYEVEVMTTVSIDKDATYTGVFSDKSARVAINVTGAWKTPGK